MSSSFSAVRRDAMGLTVSEREQLANELFESLSEDAKRSIELEWVREAETRYEQLVSGSVQPVDGATVSKNIRGML